MILWFVIALCVAFAAFALYLYLNQGRMVFFPSRTISVTPENVNLAYEDVYLDVGAGHSIHAWHFPAAEGRKTVLFCHGNAGNISDRLETVQMLVGLDVGVLLFDYRGYGRSDGTPSEERMYADATAAYRWLCRDGAVSPADVIVFGRSLGGAVAVDLASGVECGGLIVESSFTSMAELGRRMYPYMPINLLLRFRFDSLAKIGRVRCPILVTHSPQDELIPFEMGRQLYAAAPAPKRFVELQGGHNEHDYMSNYLYINGLSEFIGSL